MGREESTCRWEKAVKANQQSQRPDLNAGRRRRHPAPICAHAHPAQSSQRGDKRDVTGPTRDVPTRRSA